MGRSLSLRHATSWWFQPIWKICSSKWIVSRNWDDNKKNETTNQTKTVCIQGIFWETPIFKGISGCWRVNIKVFGSCYRCHLVTPMFWYLQSRLPMIWSHLAKGSKIRCKTFNEKCLCSQTSPESSFSSITLNHKFRLHDLQCTGVCVPVLQVLHNGT